MSEVWRKPTESDKGNIITARHHGGKGKFIAEWNEEYNCWAIAGSPHDLVLVSEVLVHENE